MGIEAVVRGGGVQYPRAELRQMHLGDIAHVLCHRITAVGHGRGVFLRGSAEDIGPTEGIRPGLGNIGFNGISPDQRCVHFTKQIQCFRTLVSSLNASQHAVCLQVSHRGHRHPWGGQRPGAAAAKIDPGQDVRLIGIEVANGAPQPPFIPHFVGLAGVPDVHRAKVRAIGVRVANPLNDGHLSLIPQCL